MRCWRRTGRRARWSRRWRGCDIIILMLKLIEQHREQIAALCRQYGVRRLELFGSAARGDFDSQASDLDFMVEFLSDDWKGAADRWFGLQEGLETLFEKKVD